MHINKRLSSGFHIIDSLIDFANLGDTITVCPSNKLTLSVTGPFSPGLSTGKDNLVIKAAELLATFAGMKPKAKIELKKNLPVASGIGGGSADAAATLKSLSVLWGIQPSSDDLNKLATELGADVPVCLKGVTSFVKGADADITTAPALPNYWLVLVNPNQPVSTKEVFANRKGSFTSTPTFNYNFNKAEELAKVLTGFNNDLTSAATLIAPIINNVLDALKETHGQLLTRLSGSGATCFALYASKYAATSAAKRLKNKYPSWWIQATSMISHKK